MTAVNVISAMKCAITITCAGRVGKAYHINVKCDCKTCVQHWTYARSAWRLYLQADVLLRDIFTQLTQLHQDPNKPKAAL